MINHLDVGCLVFSLTVFAIYKWLQCSGIFFRQQRLRTSFIVSFLCFFLLKDFTLYGTCCYATGLICLVVIDCTCSVCVRLPRGCCSALVVQLFSRSVFQIQGSRAKCTSLSEVMSSLSTVLAVFNAALVLPLAWEFPGLFD